MADDKGIRPIGNGIPTPDTLQPVTKVETPFQDSEFIPQIQLYREDIPIEYRSFDINSAMQIFKEALEVLKNALSIWEKIKIFIGKLEAPKLSDMDKILLIKDIPVLKSMSKSERKNYLANKLIK